MILEFVAGFLIEPKFEPNVYQLFLSRASIQEAPFIPGVLT